MTPDAWTLITGALATVSGFGIGRGLGRDALVQIRAAATEATLAAEHAVQARTRAEAALVPLQEDLDRTARALSHAGEAHEEVRVERDRTLVWERHAGEGWAKAAAERDEARDQLRGAQADLAVLQARWDHAFKRPRGPGGRIVAQSAAIPTADMPLEPAQDALEAGPDMEATPAHFGSAQAEAVAL